MNMKTLKKIEILEEEKNAYKNLYEELSKRIQQIQQVAICLINIDSKPMILRTPTPQEIGEQLRDIAYGKITPKDKQ